MAEILIQLQPIHLFQKICKVKKTEGHFLLLENASI